MIPYRHTLYCVLVLGAISVAPLACCAQASSDDAALVRRARELLARHQPEQAEALVQPLLSLTPDNADALALLAEVRLDQGNRDEASKLLVRALAASPNSIEANNALGGLFLGEHHCPEAMDRFETVLKLDAQNPEAQRGELSAATELALSADKSGRPEIALKVLQHARLALPGNQRLLVDLGAEATALHLLPDAADALEAARKIGPHDPDTLYALAQLEIEQQHMADAEADLSAYLAIKPDDASAHFGLGHVYAMQQRVDQARAEFNRSIELQPIQTECYYQLGQLELDAQHDAQATPLFRKVLARDPNHGGALAGMGIIAFRAKGYASAEDFLSRAEKSAPDYAPAHYYRGLALARLGKKEDAAAELHLAAQLGHAAANPHRAPAEVSQPQ